MLTTTQGYEFEGRLENYMGYIGGLREEIGSGSED
jgi:hypothetical protein